MRGGDNLSIQVSADTSKLRADLARAEAELRGFNKELRKAADAGDTRRVDDLSRSIDSASKSVAAFKRQLRGTPEALVATANATRTAETAFAGFNSSLVGMTKGFAGIAGISAIASAFTKVKDELLELNRMSLSTGFDPSTLKAFNEAAEDTGAEAGSGYKALIKLSQAFGEAREAAKAAGQAIGGAGAAISVFRGNQGTDAFGVNIMRGGFKNATPEIKSASDALKVLRVDMFRFKDTAEGNRAALQAVIDGFARLRKAGKIDQANLAAMQLFGKGMREIVPVLDEIAKSGGTLNDAIAKLEKDGQAPVDAAIARAKELQKAYKGVGDQVDILMLSFMKAFGPDIVAFIAEGEKRLKAEREEIDRIIASANAMDEAFARGTDRVFAFAAALDESLVKGWNRVTAAASAAAAEIGKVPANIGGGPDPASVFARGGTVPGSGSGDTVPALLTPGEFVVNKQSARRAGYGFLRNLNAQRYAMGGIVDRLHAPVRGFAEGGLVSAETSDGISVNLHFPGGSFGLRGDKSIVAGLTREARRAGMRSAGRQPGMAA